MLRRKKKCSYFFQGIKFLTLSFITLSVISMIFSTFVFWSLFFDGSCCDDLLECSSYTLEKYDGFLKHAIIYKR